MGLGIFRRAFVVRRFGGENIVDGYGVSGYKDFIASLNVQPLSKDELQALPEGENTVKRMKAFGRSRFPHGRPLCWPQSRLAFLSGADGPGRTLV